MRRGVRATAWLLALVTPLGPGGCATELVRVSVEPAALEAAGELARLEGDVTCQVEDDFKDEFDSGHPGFTYAPFRAAFDAQTLSRLKAALRGVFAVASSPGDPSDAADAPCEARLRLTSVSHPTITTGARVAVFASACLLVGIPFCFIWTDREPDLADRYRLEVGVRGEAVTAVYEVLARGTVRAQTPGPDDAMQDLVAHRAALRDEAVRALVSRFRADTAAQARLRAQLTRDLPTDPGPFLVAEERHPQRARWRTRRLISWTNSALTGWAAEARTAELREALTRLQTCSVDLSHQAQLLVDQAEACVARGAEAEARAARELALACRERVEALRPVLEAAREELEARAR
ncbi:MAG: hypothetical protein KF878_33020 [Planctomycetes bacterium]|nr:hypothetical protein [Planctomycetota bacterium]